MPGLATLWHQQERRKRKVGAHLRHTAPHRTRCGCCTQTAQAVVRCPLQALLLRGPLPLRRTCTACMPIVHRVSVPVI